MSLCTYVKSIHVATMHFMLTEDFEFPSRHLVFKPETVKNGLRQLRHGSGVNIVCQSIKRNVSKHRTMSLKNRKEVALHLLIVLYKLTSY